MFAILCLFITHISLYSNIAFHCVSFFIYDFVIFLKICFVTFFNKNDLFYCFLGKNVI